MNIQEAIKELMSKAREITFGEDDNVYLSRNRTIELISQIDEPQKPAVSRVALEYYEKYKDTLTAFDEWFGDFYDGGFGAEFPQGEKLAEWLYDNDSDTNRQRELALATLIVNGPSAVEVEKLYTVEIPNAYHGSLGYSPMFDNFSFYNKQDATEIRFELTESEIKQDFEWAWREEFAKEVEYD